MVASGAADSMDVDRPAPEKEQIAHFTAQCNRNKVNGQLFSGGDEVPRFSKIARSYLLHVGGLDWTKINPDIFGSMIQAVAEDEERGELGMHYTSVPNILKVLNPLFLDDLRAKLEEAGDNPRTLLNLRKRIADYEDDVLRAAETSRSASAYDDMSVMIDRTCLSFS